MRENDEACGKTFTYTYDNSGNILNRKEYAYTTGTTGSATDTVIYTYGDSGWKDLLTAYDGQTITYDAVGNPLSYRNGMSFTWEHGRRLASASLSDGTHITYTYNPEGMRTGKTVGNQSTEYFMDASGNIHGMKQGNDRLIFMYDSTGRREGFRWLTGTTDHGAYYYVYNIQGDVVAIVSDDLVPVVYYEYDSWGKLMKTTGASAATVGRLNPFRYRGYCYDEETGFYYVSTRYYDPEVGRFISADTTDVLGVSGDLYDKNLYAYCDNNPVMRVDEDGEFWTVALVNIGINVFSSVLTSVVTGDDYTFSGFVKDVGIGMLGASSYGDLVVGIASAALAMNDSYRKGGNMRAVIFSGLTTVTTTVFSISNLAGLSNDVHGITVKTVVDTTIGAGMSLVTSISNNAVVQNNKRKSKPYTGKIWKPHRANLPMDYHKFMRVTGARAY